MSQNIKIFSGTSGCKLAGKIADKLDIPLGQSKILKFKDGEFYAKIDETVRGADVYVVQSTSMPVNENIMGLLIFIDALKRASAKSINLVIPYYGYARQDRKASPREPITAKLVANLLTTAGATRVITMDLHTDQLQGFFDIPLDNLQAMPLIANNFIERGLSGNDMVVIASNTSVVKRARKLAEWLDCKIAIIDRRHTHVDSSEVMDLIGDVKGKKAIIIDDMIVTADTVVSAANLACDHGAVEVYAAATHGLFSGDAIKHIEASPIEKVFITDSIFQREENMVDKLVILSADTLFSETIKRLMKNQSILSLYEK